MTPADSLRDLQELMLVLEEEPPGRTACKTCGRAMTYADANFWLLGSAATWRIPIPVCTHCDSSLRPETKTV